MPACTLRGGSRIFEKGGSIIGQQAKKRGPGGGPSLGPMLKSLQRGPKRGVRTPAPLDPPMSLVAVYTLSITRMCLGPLCPLCLCGSFFTVDCSDPESGCPEILTSSNCSGNSSCEPHHVFRSEDAGRLDLSSTGNVERGYRGWGSLVCTWLYTLASIGWHIIRVNPSDGGVIIETAPRSATYRWNISNMEPICFGDAYSSEATNGCSNWTVRYPISKN